MKKTTALALLSLVLAAHSARAERSVDRTVSVSPDVTVEIDNTAGSVRVVGWSRSEIQVTGTYGDDVEQVTVEGRGSRVVVEVEIPEGRSYGRRDIDAYLEISVPTGARIEAETVSASIDVADLTGTVELGTVSGEVTIEGAPESVDAETVSGGIRVRGAKTLISAESVSGAVRLEGVADRVEVSTVSGSIDVDASEVSQADFESVSGTVTFEGSLAPRARFEVSSHSGGVRLYLPADVSATFEVSTFSGNIENDFGATARRTSKYVSAQSLDFTTGSGSAEVSIESFSGNVDIRKR
jgi:DUF4097 and DUF4098 domain-containing protein YvlB